MGPFSKTWYREDVHTLLPQEERFTVRMKSSKPHIPLLSRSRGVKRRPYLGSKVLDSIYTNPEFLRVVTPWDHLRDEVLTALTTLFPRRWGVGQSFWIWITVHRSHPNVYDYYPVRTLRSEDLPSSPFFFHTQESTSSELTSKMESFDPLPSLIFIGSVYDVWEFQT